MEGLRLELSEIIEGIQLALSDKHVGRRWVSQFILSSMSSDSLEYAVKNNLDPWASVYTKYHLDNPAVALMARGLLREYWDGRDGIGNTLTDVRKVYNRLAQNPVNQKLLKRQDTLLWLNRAVTHCYENVYNFTWES
jgi:hypothetical protein